MLFETTIFLARGLATSECAVLCPITRHPDTIPGSWTLPDLLSGGIRPDLLERRVKEVS